MSLLIIFAAIAAAVMAVLGFFIAPTINVAALPEAFLETIRPHLPLGVQARLQRGEVCWIHQDELRRLQQIHCEIVANQERVHRAEIAALEAEGARALARSKKKFLASLPADERGLLEARLQATAEAEARAQFDCRELQNEIAVLHDQIGRLHLENKRLQRLQRDVQVVHESRSTSGFTITNMTLPKGTSTQLLAMLIGEQVTRDNIKD